jgi:hypothetical protein
MLEEGGELMVKVLLGLLDGTVMLFVMVMVRPGLIMTTLTVFNPKHPLKVPKLPESSVDVTVHGSLAPGDTFLKD